MKIKIENYVQGTTRVIEYPFTVLQFIKIHYGAWGFLRVEKTGTNKYEIFDNFNGSHVCTVSKAGKRDAVTE